MRGSPLQELFPALRLCVVRMLELAAIVGVPAASVILAWRVM